MLCSFFFYSHVSIACQQSSGPFQMVHIFASSHLPVHLNQSIMSTKYLIQVCREQLCGSSGKALRTGPGNADRPEDSSSRNLSRWFIEYPSNQESWAASSPSFVCYEPHPVLFVFVFIFSSIWQSS